MHNPVKTRSFELALNALFHKAASTAGVDGVILRSFAHNENEEAVLKYDLHLPSPDAFKAFQNAWEALLNSVAGPILNSWVIAGEMDDLSGPEACLTTCSLAELVIDDEDGLSSLYLGFFAVDVEDDNGLVYSMEVVPRSREAELAFVSAVSQVLDKQFDNSQDDAVYKDILTDDPEDDFWCWGPRYIIMGSGIATVV